jgi:RNA polymerase sigma factor (sigma-70 family)
VAAHHLDDLCATRRCRVTFRRVVTTIDEMIADDAELVERSRKADADAFGALVERHQQLVFGVALARCHDPALAEDVAQEAFVTAWRDLDRLRDGDRVGSWVAGIARNLASSAVRQRVRKEAIALPAPAGDAASPEDEALEREDRELLHRALADVPDTYREVLVLFYLQGESIVEIASALGIRADLVKQRLSRGRNALRDSVAARVESTLTRTRLSPAFRAGVVAALATAGTRKAAAGAAGKSIATMSLKQIAIAGASLAALGGGALWLGTRATAQPTTTSPPAVHAAAQPASLHVQRIADPKQRAALRETIRLAREHRAAAASAAPPAAQSGWRTMGETPALPADGDLDKDYVREAVRELIPLIAECYEEGVSRNGMLAGTIVEHFTIEGEPGVGGVISDSQVDPDQSTITDPTVRECIQETMYGLQIDPPASGKVEVTYPFSFRPAE